MAPVKKPKPILGAHYFRAWRDFREVSQEAAAAAINVERGTLSKIENGKVPYQQQYVEGLARLYRCRPSDLIGTDPQSAVQSPEALLRAALLGFGVDAEELGRAISAVRVFLDDPDEQSGQGLPDDQSASSNPRRVKAPS